MRYINAHQVTDADDSVELIAVDEKSEIHGANHEYFINYAGINILGDRVPRTIEVNFQNGPVKENTLNGITQEVLLAIVIDRLEGFQSGQFACDANESALASTRAALKTLQDRTRDRMNRGVEGTQQK